MTLTTTIMASDMTAIFADFPQTLTFMGTSYSCAAGDIEYGQDLVEEGLRDSVRAVLVIVNVDFTNGIPQKNQKITYNGVEMRILNANPCADTISTTLVCTDKMR